MLREEYYVPWKDETTEQVRRSMDYIAFEISEHTVFSFGTCKERIYRFVGWLFTLSEGRKKEA